MSAEEKKVVLSVKDLAISFSTDSGYVQAVRGISFDLYKGGTLCIVGESGSGKSVTCKAIMGILAANGRIKGGSIMYEGEDLTKVSEDEFHRIRGHKIGMIFQDPLSSLNPIVRIGKQLTEVMLINGDRLKKIYQDKVADELIAYKNAQTLLKSGIANAKDRIHFLKVDRKKNTENYDLHHNLAGAKVYTAEQEYLARRDHLLLDYENKKKELLSSSAAKERQLAASGAAEEELKRLRAADLAALGALKAEARREAARLRALFIATKAPLSHERTLEKRANRKGVRVLRREYGREIGEAKADYRATKRELKVKYAPLIRDTKRVFKAKSKVAKKEVRAYKAGLMKEYQAKRKPLLREWWKAASLHARKHARANLRKLREEHVAQLRVTKREAKERAIKVMAEVGISEPARRFRQYPFEFSGGMRQRIVIAIALTADPDILICDEPTTALDVTIQAQILELINNLKRSRNLSCIFITHDLGVVANMADRVAVMYAGKIVEWGTVDEIFYDPRHPYTWALLSSIPDVDSKERLEAIPGTPPNMIYPPKGDAFALRSRYAMAIDFKREPPTFKISETHYASTWLLDPRAPKVRMPAIVAERIRKAMAKRKALAALNGEAK